MSAEDVEGAVSRVEHDLFMVEQLVEGSYLFADLRVILNNLKAARKFIGEIASEDDRWLIARARRVMDGEEV